MREATNQNKGEKDPTAPELEGKAKAKAKVREKAKDEALRVGEKGKVIQKAKVKANKRAKEQEPKKVNKLKRKVKDKDSQKTGKAPNQRPGKGGNKCNRAKAGGKQPTPKKPRGKKVPKAKAMERKEKAGMPAKEKIGANRKAARGGNPSGGKKILEDVGKCLSGGDGLDPATKGKRK